MPFVCAVAEHVDARPERMPLDPNRDAVLEVHLSFLHRG
jgi:hypothetical protein